jgi:nucleoside-diphosphate-sugar epimerase
MRIVGSGLIARSLGPYSSRHVRAVAFASGVSDSEREHRLLNQTIAEARSLGETITYFSGAGAVYGRWDHPALEAELAEPQTPYGRHQLACEAVVAAAGVPYLITRLPNVVASSASPKQLVPNLVRQVLAGRVHVHGRATRDLVGAEDMARVVSELLDRPSGAGIMNVASGHSVPVTSIVSEICVILRIDASIEIIDIGEPQRFDTSRLRAILGRDPFPDHGYYREVLRRYVPPLAEELAHAGV